MYVIRISLGGDGILQTTLKQCKILCLRNNGMFSFILGSFYSRIRRKRSTCIKGTQMEQLIMSP